MVWLFCVGIMAAFGIICALWALFGWLLPGNREGLVICFGTPGLPESGFIRRYLFLRDWGLLGSDLLVVDQGLAEPERRWLENRRCGIELCEPEELPARLELERKRIAGNGNGDHTGRDQRCGVSEL